MNHYLLWYTSFSHSPPHSIYPSINLFSFDFLIFLSLSPRVFISHTCMFFCSCQCAPLSVLSDYTTTFLSCSFHSLSICPQSFSLSFIDSVSFLPYIYLCFVTPYIYYFTISRILLKTCRRFSHVLIYCTSQFSADQLVGVKSDLPYNCIQLSVQYSDHATRLYDTMQHVSVWVSAHTLPRSQ